MELKAELREVGEFRETVENSGVTEMGSLRRLF
jgi:hypothetical protein